jgi:hypothetical protein
VGIDPPQTAAHQGVGLNEQQDFLVVSNWRAWEAPEKFENLGPAPQRTTGEFSNDKRMTEHLLLEEQGSELPIGDSQVIDPDGRVNEDHARFRRTRRRRRGTGRTALSDPPKAARRLALSRATSASSPALTTAVFSRSPLNSVARPSRESSILRVVRICISMSI